MIMYAQDSAYQKKLLLAVKKAQWTLTKINAMIKEDAYCVDIAQQVSASIGLLKGVNTLLLKNHFQCCGKKKLSSNNKEEVAEFIEELVGVWSILNK